MLWLSFYSPCKTSCKMPKMVREICVQVRGSQRTFLPIFGNLNVCSVDCTGTVLRPDCKPWCFIMTPLNNKYLAAFWYVCFPFFRQRKRWLTLKRSMKTLIMSYTQNCPHSMTSKKSAFMGCDWCSWWPSYLIFLAMIQYQSDFFTKWYFASYLYNTFSHPPSLFFCIVLWTLCEVAS